ncbi:hypothetical protein, partial [Clostridium perfringens]
MKYFLSALMVALCASVHAAPGAHGPNGEHLDGPSVPTTSNSLSRLPDGSVNVPMLAQRRLAIRTTFITEQDAGVTV